jgi:hypothetical protein
MEDERRKQFMELIQTKIGADDADPGWMLAWIGFEVLDVLSAIAHETRMTRSALIGHLQNEYLETSEDQAEDVSISDQLNAISIAIGELAGRKC